MARAALQADDRVCRHALQRLADSEERENHSGRELDRAVRAVTERRDFDLYGSGRTDAGVHALAQVAHLDVGTTLPADALRRRINDELPADINILAADQVPHRFHARRDAVARRHLYQISRRRTAFAKAYVGRGHEMPGDPARFTAPPSGLFLERVFYKGDSRDVPLRAATPLGSL